MKKIAIIGANSFQNRLILKAKEMGYETHVFAWECGDIGEKTADFFYPISIVEKEQILEKCREIMPDGVASIASDLAVITVNYVAEKLGLTCNNYNDSIICTNKYEMRKAFCDGGVPVPKFLKVSEMPLESELVGFVYPLIVKPTDRSGSRGIMKITEFSELASAVSSAAEQSFEKCAVIEEFIEGNEYSCECVSYNGIHNFLAFTKKYTTGAPHFIETGHRQPSDIPEEYHENIKSSIFKALDSLNIKFGASHTEFKLLPHGDIRIIEIGARMGGDCIGSDLVELSTGVDFVAAVVDIACGKAPDLTPRHPKQNAVIRFMFNEADINALEEVKLNSKVNITYISEIETENMGKVTDSSNRVGYYIYTE